MSNSGTHVSKNIDGNTLKIPQDTAKKANSFREPHRRPQFLISQHFGNEFGPLLMNSLRIWDAFLGCLSVVVVNVKSTFERLSIDLLLFVARV